MTQSTRAAARLAFARTALGYPQLELESASSDASFRSYWRTRTVQPSRIVMDAPPDKEDLGPWLDIAGRLRRAGVNAPEVLAEDRGQGFLLLSDLGTRLYLPALTAETVEPLYGAALDALQRMQTGVDCSGLPAYDEIRLRNEMDLLPAWFLGRHLGIEPDAAQREVIEAAFRALIANALEQPQGFVHRDYHSRNLMLGDAGPGVIDFQDAVLGPLTYDLVSLLRDCYIAWPEPRVYTWVEQYRQRLHAAGFATADRAEFARWFDLMGLQRHIKVLGIFCRLWYRDGKAGYLNDLPLVWHYTRSVGRRYAEIAPLVDLIEMAIGERDIVRPGSTETASCAR